MMDIRKIFERHKRAVLMYSGGKDSLACLLLLRGYWNRLDVVWVNTGNQFPEVVEHMEAVRSLVPHFTELKSDTSSYLKVNGFPVDVVPTRHTATGHYIYGATPLKVCSRFDCCGTNIWKPMADYLTMTKPTCVIRGDRGSERERGLESADGIEFAFPIFDWSAKRVLDFISSFGGALFQERHKLPEGSSLDCMTCTAYNCEHASRMRYLRERHPHIYREAVRFFKDYTSAVAAEMSELLEGQNGI